MSFLVNLEAMRMEQAVTLGNTEVGVRRYCKTCWANGNFACQRAFTSIWKGFVACWNHNLKRT